MLYISIALSLFLVVSIPVKEKPGRQLKPWQKGYLDIHHINTGQGDAAYFIFPDGTTMLFDAGDFDSEAFNISRKPLKATSLHPDDSKSAGQWIDHYIKHVTPVEHQSDIDYALVSHFHSDHYGYVTEASKDSKTGAYKLTGLTEVGELIPIRMMIDRAGPALDYPVDLKSHYQNNETFMNYLRFIEYHTQEGTMKADRLIPGADDQIVLKEDPASFPLFKVRNVKANGTIWDGNHGTIEILDPGEIIENGKFNENPLSLAIKLSYGPFDYFTGGDNTGMSDYGNPEWFDVETPMTEFVGAVEVSTLNHHGNRDATNSQFVKNLSPRVVVQQTWCSDHPGMEVFYRLAHLNKLDSCDLFATNIHEETKVAFGPWFVKGYESMSGHVLIRVLPGGKEFYVITLDDETVEITVKEVFGPYQSK